MKHSTLFNFLIIIALSNNLFGHGAPHDNKVTFKQPFGAEIEVQLHGTHYYARSVCEDGYTVVYDNSDKTYYYAQLNNTGEEFIPTGLAVGRDKPTGIAKNLKLSSKARVKIASTRKEKFGKHQEEDWEARVQSAKSRRALSEGALFNSGEGAESQATARTLSASAIVGSKIGLTILVDFPDDPDTAAVDPTTFPVTQEKIERYCNEIGYNDNNNTGSVRDYFRDQSNNLLDYTMKVTPIVTLDQPRNYYNFSDYPTNNTIRDGGATGRLLIRDAIAKLNDLEYDFDGLTLEGSNVVSTNVLFAGATSGVWPNGLWPHQWVMDSPRPTVTVDGNTRNIYAYQVTNLPNASPTVGTFIHESGHLLLDLPDLYDYGGESAGVGRHGIMASGNFANGGKTPTPLNMYFKDILEWATVNDLLPTSYSSVSIPSTGNIGYRIRKPDSTNEYFIVENRGTGDPWATSAPDKGILIWHVDESVSGNNNEQMTQSQHYEVSLMQQDGSFDLEANRNSGDSQDAYDNNSPLFSDNSNPDAKWWDGSNSGIIIDVNSSAGANMNVTFGLENSIFITAPQTGGSASPGNSYDITWITNTQGSLNIDLYKAGVLLQNIATNETDDGLYTWNVDPNLIEASDYVIRITNTINTTYYAESGSFSLKPEAFAGGGVLPNAWVQSPGSTAGWITTNDESSEGVYSIKNVDIDNNQTAAIEYTGVFTDGSISFDAKVGTEARYDFLYLYIDGSRVDINPDTSMTGYAGTVDWINITVPITSGSHTVKFEYYKDSSVSVSPDTVWVDNVSLPLSTNTQPVITLTSPTSNDINIPGGVGLILESNISDDTTSTGNLTLSWSQTSGTGTATFESTGTANTAVTFSANGTYVLNLAVSDSELTANLPVTVNVSPSVTIGNTGPAISLPSPFTTTSMPFTQTPIVTDDNLPINSLTTTVSEMNSSGLTLNGNSIDTNTQGSYTLRYVAHDTAIKTYFDQTLVYQTTPVAFFDEWAQTNIGAGSTLSGDDDGDGVSNLLEYATGGSSSSQDEEPGALGLLEDENDDLFLSFTMRQRKNAVAQGISYTVYKSQNLSNWDTSQISEVATVSVDSEFDDVTYRIDAPVAEGEPPYFIRCKVAVAE